ncbi:MAG: Trp family transcriptional regulator [Spirochaetales bacterium]
MPTPSKTSASEDPGARQLLLEGSFDELTRVLTASGDPQLVKAFLTSLLTPSERLDIAARWELVNRINLGETQRQVASELGVSLCKITRGSKELKKPDSAFKAMLRLRDELG